MINFSNYCDERFSSCLDGRAFVFVYIVIIIMLINKNDSPSISAYFINTFSQIK